MMRAGSVVRLGALALPLGGALSSGCADVLGIGELDAGPRARDAATAEAAASPDATSLDAACVTVTVADTGMGDPSSCVLPGNVCSPKPPMSAPSTWTTPVPQDVCSTAQDTEFIDDCETTSVGCSSFVMKYPKCFGCLVPDTIANSAMLPTSGAILEFDQDDTFEVSYLWPNVAGCIATLEPCSVACAEVTFALFKCQVDSCSPRCASDSDFQNCINAAESCTCGALSAATTGCWNEIRQRGSPAAACLPSNAGTQSVSVILQTMCSGEL
jgi:hypothetical protein